MSIYYTEKKEIPKITMTDVVDILQKSADFDSLKAHICTDIERTAKNAAEEAGLDFSQFTVDMSSAMNYIHQSDDSEELEGILYKYNSPVYNYFIHTGISFRGPLWATFSICLRIDKLNESNKEFYSKILQAWCLFEEPYQIAAMNENYENILVSGTAESDFLGCIMDNIGNISPDQYIMMKKAYNELIQLYIEVKGFMQFTTIPIPETSTPDNDFCWIGIEPRNPLIGGIAVSEDKGIFTLYQIMRPGHGNNSPFDTLNKQLEYERKSTCCFYNKIAQTYDFKLIKSILSAVADHYEEDMIYRIPLSLDFYTEASCLEEIGTIIKPFEKKLHRELNETEEVNNQKIAEFAALAMMELEEIS